MSRHSYTTLEELRSLFDREYAENNRTACMFVIQSITGGNCAQCEELLNEIIDQPCTPIRSKIQSKSTQRKTDNV